MRAIGTCVSARTSILYVGYNSDAVVLQAIVTSIAPLFGAQFFLRRIFDKAEMLRVTKQTCLSGD